ncbi:hypothetical protein BN946_scf185030.g3 [Trametes cinnabarina]|uniref:Uncharacterized protein n=1 Tax=Pycnoporus cinnabarinus TaxID=5643 RepID=A0A060SU94_PYCCI|nr:hypothetical protein BN946_scf185030.g3 [Trametes cinnabarina]
MESTPPEPEDSSSNVGSQVLRSPRARSKAASSVRQLEDHVNGNGGEEEGEDIRSDVQENASEVARTIPIHTTGVPEREPGPDDPPGPHFESYGSSFGNFGPLPRESFTGNKQWNGVSSPSRAAGVPLPETVLHSPTSSYPNPFQQYGMAPVATTGIGGAPYAGAPSGIGSRTRGPTSKISHKSPSAAENGLLSPKSASRALSPTRTATGAGAGPERPLSPRTAASQNQSVKSRNTQKTQRTAYPPLPESVVDDGQRTQKAYSIAPSESASQIGNRRLRQQQQLQQAEMSQKPAKSVKSNTEVNGHAATDAPAYTKSQSAGEDTRSFSNFQPTELCGSPISGSDVAGACANGSDVPSSYVAEKPGLAGAS